MKQELKKTEKGALSDIFNSILSSAKKENEEAFGDVIKKISTQIKSPEDFDLLFFYPLREIVEAAICKYSGRELKDSEADRAAFIVNNYSFVENNIEKLIYKIEGYACQADKSRFITHSLFRHFVFGEEIKAKAEEKEYWKPNFWNDNKGQEWIDLLEALIDLHFGESVKYLLFMKTTFIPLLAKKEKENKK